MAQYTEAECLRLFPSWPLVPADVYLKSAELDRMLSPNLIRGAPPRGAPQSTEPPHGAGAAAVLAARFASSGALECFRMEDCFHPARKWPC
jgi:hypothetical protein